VGDFRERGGFEWSSEVTAPTQNPNSEFRILDWKGRIFKKGVKPLLCLA
jgi:hypothetical protein